MGIPFKLYEGKEANLPAELIAGGIYFCEDSGNVFIDVDIDGTITRVPLGKKYVDDQLVDIREFIENQGSGIEISSDPPTKESANVWIDTDDEDDEGVEYLGVVTSINGQGGDVNITASDIDAVGSELLAAAGGVATLGEDSKLLDEQIPGLDKLGAAPAGYGLGGINAQVGDWNNAINAGFYAAPQNSPDNQWWHGIVENYANAVIIQRAWKAYINNDKISTSAAERTGVAADGVITWEPWEYVSPLMELGKEYRTTERYLGKPVYVRLVDFGALPNATQSTVSHGISDLEYCIDVSGNANGYNLIGYSGVEKVFCGTSSIAIKTSENLTAFSANVLLKYTKTTD